MVDELRATRPEQEVEAEVVFEGEQTLPVPEPEAPGPEVEAEESQAESSAEPFWQTWLKMCARLTLRVPRQPENGRKNF